MRILGSVLAVAALCLLLAGNASATSTGWITMSFVSASPGETVSYVAPTKSGTTTAGVYNQSVNLSPLKYGDYNIGREASKFIEGLGDGVMGFASAQTFCADINQYASYSPFKYEIYTPESAPVVTGSNMAMGSTKAADLRKLWGAYNTYGLGVDDWGVGEEESTPDTAEKKQQAAAFQLAVWEIINEAQGTLGGYAVATGTMRASGSASTIDLANAWLGTLGAMEDPDIGLRVLVNGTYQDFAIVVTGAGRDTVPEPVTMAGLMLGIGGLSGYIRKRRRA